MIFNSLKIFSSGIILFLLLPICIISKSVRVSYYTYLRSQVETDFPIRTGAIDMTFDICVFWLLLVGKWAGKTYNEVNIWIFCVIWPIITLASIILNIILLSTRTLN